MTPNCPTTQMSSAAKPKMPSPICESCCVGHVQSAPSQCAKPLSLSAQTSFAAAPHACVKSQHCSSSRAFVHCVPSQCSSVNPPPNAQTSFDDVPQIP